MSLSNEEIMRELEKRPSPIDPERWVDMDPKLRIRFHELGNHIARLEGLITGLAMRTPEKPETIPLLESKVALLDERQRDILGKVENVKTQIGTLDVKIAASQKEVLEEVGKVDEKVNSLLLKTVGATSFFAALFSTLAQIALR